jgi:hypothetical protein
MKTQLDRLAELARRLLPSMLDDASGLYSHKARWSPTGVRSEGSNALYSAMTAIGIQRDDRVSEPKSPALERTLDAIHAHALHACSPAGLLPTTIWAFAVARDDRTRSLVKTLGDRLRPSRSSSMELGLTLSGLAAAMAAFPGSRQSCSKLAAIAKEELLDRYSDSGRLFRARSRTLSSGRNLDWRMTSFASQVYPIHGLAQLAQVSETDPSTEIQRAAERLVEKQGPLGQWWWTYSLRNGRVLDGYPVYSVHQDAMAFMALAPLQNLGVRSYGHELARGLRWIFGENELGCPLVDFDRPFVSRCIQRRGADADGSLGMSKSQRRRALFASWGLRSTADRDPGEEQLELLEECRPYHLGWVLYARSLIRDW